MSLYLYYDNNKGLVKSQFSAVGEYIMEHDEKGWDAPHHEQTLEIPNRNVKIVVNTNLGWGPRSYMVAKISMIGKSVLNFLDTSLKHSVKIVYAEPGNWDMLFDGIISLYNNIFNSENSINAYFDEINKCLVNTTGNPVDKMVEVTTRLSEVADCLSDSIFSDSQTARRRMRKTCGLVIRQISSNWDKKWITEGRHKKLEANLHSIVLYLAEKGEILDALTKRDPNELT